MSFLKLQNYKFFNFFPSLTSHLSSRAIFQSSQYDKKKALDNLIEAKQKLNLSFKFLSNELNVNKVWLTSVFLGKHPIDKNVCVKLLKILKIEISENLIQTLTCIPENRIANESCTDPVVTRLNELVQIYGDSIKTLIQEEAGDGIMSAIDCSIFFETIGENKETRIVIKIDGKFLPYKTKN